MIVGTLLTFMQEEQSFWMLNVFVDNYGMKDIIGHGFPKMGLLSYQLSAFISAFMPQIHGVLTKFDLTPDYYAVQWFITLYSYDLPTKSVAHIWDLFLAKGWKVIIKVALALVQSSGPHITGMNEEQATTFMKTYVRERKVPIGNLIYRAYRFPVTNRLLNHLERLYQRGAPSQLTLTLVGDKFYWQEPKSRLTDIKDKIFDSFSSVFRKSTPASLSRFRSMTEGSVME